MNSTTRRLVTLVALILLAFHPRLGGQTTLSVSTLHSFTSGTDGEFPMASLIQGSDGNFYGTTRGTEAGDATVNGTVFQMTPGGVLTTLHAFTNLGTDGAHPFAGLVQGSDGNFYGTTLNGSSSQDGTVFRITPAGAFTTLYSFMDSDGTGPAGPDAGLVQGNDGNFYGVTAAGGSSSVGTIFRITPAGALSVLHNFTPVASTGQFNDDGVGSALIQGRDGNFYGTIAGGEDIDVGEVYRITPAGDYTSLHTFLQNGADYPRPEAGLVQGSGGNFYGTTVGGGASDDGTVFLITPAGALTTLYSFTGTGADGAYPYAALIQGRDGNFYGTTSAGGSGDYGTVFKLGYFPAVTSAATATATEGKTFSYQIKATNSPTRFGFQGNANGLTIDASTGVISGTPKATGSYPYTLNAYNSFGKGSAPLTLTVQPTGPPAITSAATAAGKVGTAFSYQITATNDATRFGFQGNANGLTINSSTGVISGTPKAAGTFTYTLNAYNTVGKGSATLTVTLAPVDPPVITSATTATGKAGTAFSYQVTATNDATSFGFQGNANGLTINSSTGLISGTPKAAGSFSYTLNAYNSIGKGSATLSVTITSS